jgi:hypothetical protein
MLPTRYAQERDFFSPRELARLRFLRWLYRRGRLIASPPAEEEQEITVEIARGQMEERTA